MSCRADGCVSKKEMCVTFPSLRPRLVPSPSVNRAGFVGAYPCRSRTLNMCAPHDAVDPFALYIYLPYSISLRWIFYDFRYHLVRIHNQLYANIHTWKQLRLVNDTRFGFPRNLQAMSTSVSEWFSDDGRTLFAHSTMSRSSGPGYCCLFASKSVTFHRWGDNVSAQSVVCVQFLAAPFSPAKGILVSSLSNVR